MQTGNLAKMGAPEDWSENLKHFANGWRCDYTKARPLDVPEDAGVTLLHNGKQIPATTALVTPAALTIGNKDLEQWAIVQIWPSKDATPSVALLGRQLLLQWNITPYAFALAQPSSEPFAAGQNLGAATSVTELSAFTDSVSKSQHIAIEATEDHSTDVGLLQTNVDDFMQCRTFQFDQPELCCWITESGEKHRVNTVLLTKHTIAIGNLNARAFAVVADNPTGEFGKYSTFHVHDRSLTMLLSKPDSTDMTAACVPLRETYAANSLPLTPMLEPVQVRDVSGYAAPLPGLHAAKMVVTDHHLLRVLPAEDESPLFWRHHLEVKSRPWIARVDLSFIISFPESPKSRSRFVHTYLDDENQTAKKSFFRRDEAGWELASHANLHYKIEHEEGYSSVQILTEAPTLEEAPLEKAEPTSSSCLPRPAYLLLIACTVGVGIIAFRKAGLWHRGLPAAAVPGQSR